jgi:hypothetical protein
MGFAWDSHGIDTAVPRARTTEWMQHVERRLCKRTTTQHAYLVAVELVLVAVKHGRIVQTNGLVHVAVDVVVVHVVMAAAVGCSER